MYTKQSFVHHIFRMPAWANAYEPSTKVVSPPSNRVAIATPPPCWRSRRSLSLVGVAKAKGITPRGCLKIWDGHSFRSTRFVLIWCSEFCPVVVNSVDSVTLLESIGNFSLTSREVFSGAGSESWLGFQRLELIGQSRKGKNDSNP